MEGKSREELTGFGDPTLKEKEAIRRYFYAAKRSQVLKADVLRILGGVIAALMIAAMVLSEELQKDIITGIVSVCITVVGLVFWFLYSKSAKRWKQILHNTLIGNYQVLECFLMEVYCSGEFSYGCGVKIRTQNGEICRDHLVIDNAAGRKIEHTQKELYLLLKMPDLDYYEVLQNINLTFFNS